MKVMKDVKHTQAKGCKYYLQIGSTAYFFGFAVRPKYTLEILTPSVRFRFRKKMSSECYKAPWVTFLGYYNPETGDVHTDGIGRQTLLDACVKLDKHQRDSVQYHGQPKRTP